MKKIVKILLIIILLLAAAVLCFFAYLGYVPGLSSVFGADKARDLGIKYTQADLASARAKSQIVYEALPAGTLDSQSLQRSGSRPVDAVFTSVEASALMNDRPFKYWPYEDVQVKFNADGSAEVSGKLVKSRLPGYCAAIGLPKEVAQAAVKFLPPDPVFYLKGKAALTENTLSIFEPQALEVGRLPVSLGMVLSSLDFNLADEVYAAPAESLSSELSKTSNKKAWIINYINQRIASIKGFYAKEAKFGDNQFIFNGNLSQTESTAR
ncbi:MAG: hypothetical protein WCX77_00990 [Candidatus Paceibacterota bacterium]|jgi:hypothetical protein